MDFYFAGFSSAPSNFISVRKEIVRDDDLSGICANGTYFIVTPTEENEKFVVYTTTNLSKDYPRFGKNSWYYGIVDDDGEEETLHDNFAKTIEKVVVSKYNVYKFSMSGTIDDIVHKLEKFIMYMLESIYDDNRQTFENLLYYCELQAKRGIKLLKSNEIYKNLKIVLYNDADNYDEDYSYRIVSIEDVEKDVTEYNRYHSPLIMEYRTFEDDVKYNIEEFELYSKELENIFRENNVPTDNVKNVALALWNKNH